MDERQGVGSVPRHDIVYLGRAVIAITAVGGRTSEWSVILPGPAKAIRRTAAMAMAALPDAAAPYVVTRSRPYPLRQNDPHF